MIRGLATVLGRIATVSPICSLECVAADRFALCPDFAEVGKGSAEMEEAIRCVRVMSARYSISGESPADIATAALATCEERTIAPLVKSNSGDLSDKLRIPIEGILRRRAIQTVVEMRAGNCLDKPDLYDRIYDPIDRPRVLSQP